jgi:isopenicillin N synthase-like dioxygenase
MTAGLSTIDISPLLDPGAVARQTAAEAIGAAAARDGFFYAAGCGLGPDTVTRLDAAARAFFALPDTDKRRVAMTRGGLAWRGWFPLGGELTSGAPDQKEGFYFGEELSGDDPRVAARWPMHGANLWPDQPSELRAAVETYVAETTRAAAAIMQGASLALGLDAEHFARAYLAKPTILFRFFRYPPAASEGWGVGEHTDYGLLTLLAQDEVGGLQVRTDRGWIDVPPVADTLVVNVGDMLERLSGGRFVSAPHRVRNAGRRDRLSFPLFYDPDFSAAMTPAAAPVDQAARERWDRIDPNAFSGRYGDYLLRKVSAVFPELRAASGF